MDPYQQVKEKLDELEFHLTVEHPPAFTTEQADSAPIEA